MARANVPSFQVTSALRTLITTDYNTTRSSVNNMVWKDYPRKAVDAKTKYPRITVMDVTQTGDPVSVGNNSVQENAYTVQLDVWVWDKPGDSQTVTVNSTTMSGTRARDTIAIDVMFLLRKNFYTNASLSGYYSYKVISNTVIPFDEDKGILRRSIVIEFSEMDTAAA